MSTLWLILRRFVGDFWNAAFVLMLANLLWVTGTVPGALLAAYGGYARQLPYLLVGLLLLLPWPYVTLGLFSLARAVVAGQTVSLLTFFRHSRRNLVTIYLWGGVNLLVIAVLLANVRFYNSPEAPLGGLYVGAVVSSFFTTLVVLWGVWQLFVLAALTGEESSRLGQALRRAGTMLLHQPLVVFFVASLALLLSVLGVFLPPLGLLVSFAAIAVLACRSYTELALRQGHLKHPAS